MFRFLRNASLRSTRRRSASCPNLEHASLENESVKNTPPVENDSSESESEEMESANRLERLTAQRSVQRVRLKEIEKKENVEKNMISMEDYLRKLSELKVWLKEECKKDVENMRSPKLKSHFKTFVKLWNKRKLPAKYYKRGSVDLSKKDKPLTPAYPQVSEHRQMLCYSLMDNSSTLSGPILPPPFDLSMENVLQDVGSPFATFGKSVDDPLTSPAHLVEQMNETSSGSKESGSKESNRSQSSNSQTSPQKFATIFRTTQTTPMYRQSAQPWTVKRDLRIHPVSSPKCPELPPHLTPTTRTLPGEKEKWIAGWNIATKKSPVYSCVVDEIPYSTGSPKYAEVEETLQVPHWQDNCPTSDYCSLSPLKEQKTLYTGCSQGAIKKPGLHRRRSKSMEDIYAVPVKNDLFWQQNYTCAKEKMDVFSAPPIPNRNYSPNKFTSTFLGQTDRKQTVLRYDVKTQSHTSFSDNPPSHEIGFQKRRSDESAESFQNNPSPVKKIKPVTLLDSDTNNSAMSNDDSEPQLMDTAQDISTTASSKLSILTGSLHATTRSRYKLNTSLKTPEADRAEDGSKNKPEISVLEIQQLDESPKFSRRRLKRRSSSFSTTPGKGLTFGKTSKMSSPRRVSFSKDVKDKEAKSNLQRRTSSRLGKTPVITKQTQERKEFDSFLSSHASPPRKSDSPTKTSSPLSPVKNSSPLSKLSPAQASASPQSKATNPNKISSTKLYPSPQHENKNPHVKELQGTCQIGSTFGPTINSPFAHTKTVNFSAGERLFPPSATRQVGRRVIGPPVSPQKNPAMKSPNGAHVKHSQPSEKIPSSPRKLVNQLKNPSPQRDADSQKSLASSKKLINSFVSKITEKTSVICANKFSESEGYSSNDEILSAGDYWKSADTLSIDRQAEPCLTLPELEVTVLPQKNDVLCDHSEPQHDLRSSQCQDVPDDKDDFEIVQFDTSPGSKSKIVSLDIQNSSSLQTSDRTVTDESGKRLDSISETSVKDSFLSSQEPSGCLPRFTKQNAGLETTTESKLPNLGSTVCAFDFTSSERTCTEESNSFSTRQKSGNVSHAPAQSFTSIPSKLQASPQELTVTADGKASSPPRDSSTAFTHIFSELSHHFTSSSSLDTEGSIFSELKAFEREAKIWNRHIELGTAAKPRHQNCLFQNDYNSNTGAKTAREQMKSQEHNYKVESLSSLSKDFAVLESKAVRLPSGEAKEACGVEQIKDGEGTQDTKDMMNTMQNNSDQGDVGQNAATSAGSRREIDCNLKRLESIRASPKIVDNDGWVTERRRSSRGKLHSFRSAYNRYLLKSSSKEEAAVDEAGSESSPGVDCEEVFNAPASVGNQKIPDQDVTDMIVFQKQTVDQKAVRVKLATNEINTAPPKKAKPVILPKTVATMQKKLNVSTAIISQKAKPVILPKPAATMQKKIIVSTAIISHESPGKKQHSSTQNALIGGNQFANSAHRRASCAKKEAMLIAGDQPVNSAHRRESNALTENSDESLSAVERVAYKVMQNSTVVSKNQPVEYLMRKKSSIGTARGSKRRDNEGEGRKASQGQSRRDSQGQTRRSSKGQSRRESQGDKRRSKSLTGEGETKVLSFTERRKLFQQFQSKTELVRKPLRGQQTATQQFTSSLQEQTPSSLVDKKLAANDKGAKLILGSTSDSKKQLSHLRANDMHDNDPHLISGKPSTGFTDTHELVLQNETSSNPTRVLHAGSKSCWSNLTENTVISVISWQTQVSGTLAKKHHRPAFSPQPSLLNTESIENHKQEVPNALNSTSEFMTAFPAKPLQSPLKQFACPKPYSPPTNRSGISKVSPPKSVRPLVLSPHGELKL